MGYNYRVSLDAGVDAGATGPLSPARSPSPSPMDQRDNARDVGVCSSQLPEDSSQVPLDSLAPMTSDPPPVASLSPSTELVPVIEAPSIPEDAGGAEVPIWSSMVTVNHTKLFLM